MNQPLAVILSLSGAALSETERAFFKEADPLGFILFARNCKSPDQLRALVKDLKDVLGRDCPVLIDQEGGRVQRLKPPAWRAYPPLKTFGDLAATDMEAALENLRFTTLQLAEELADAGITVNCSPVLDVLNAQTHDAIGDRAFSGDPDIVAALGDCVCRGLMEAGITPVIKHLPGHGRAASDSHKTLPRVGETAAALESDCKPFRILAHSDLGRSIWGMAAHVVYEALGPDNPASVSPEIIQGIIRTAIGFEGFLVSDDIGMDALAAYGDPAARCAAALEAGCDAVLYCAGKMDEMRKIAESGAKMTPQALQRLQKAEDFRTVGP